MVFDQIFMIHFQIYYSYLFIMVKIIQLEDLMNIKIK